MSWVSFTLNPPVRAARNQMFRLHKIVLWVFQVEFPQMTVQSDM